MTSGAAIGTAVGFFLDGFRGLNLPAWVGGRSPPLLMVSGYFGYYFGHYRILCGNQLTRLFVVDYCLRT